MQTRSEKKLRRQNRAGRPPKADASRTKSGQLSRAASVNGNKDPRIIVWEQRQKHLGLTETQARSAYVGTEYGRMLEHGIISRNQHQVCEEYARTYGRLRQTMDAPKLTPGTRCYSDAGGGSSGDHDPGRAAVIRFREVIIAFEGRERLHIALRRVVLKDAPEAASTDFENVPNFEPSEFADFVRAIEVLAKHWGMPLDSRAEAV